MIEMEKENPLDPLLKKNNKPVEIEEFYKEFSERLNIVFENFESKEKHEEIFNEKLTY